MLPLHTVCSAEASAMQCRNAQSRFDTCIDFKQSDDAPPCGRQQPRGCQLGQRAYDEQCTGVGKSYAPDALPTMMPLPHGINLANV